MDKQQAKQLLKKYSAGECNDAEKAIVESWYLHADFSSDIPSHVDIENAMNTTGKSLKLSLHNKQRFWPSIAAAASIAIAISTILYYTGIKNTGTLAPSLNELANTMPLQRGVSLKTENGPAINLSDKKTGTIRFKDGSGAKASAEHLDYSGKSQTVAIHTLSNNGADRFTLTLNDGTEASLDIGSSISYPTAFTGAAREVMVTGQTYFKVVHNSKQPFRVKTKGTVIEDIGTAFNIDAYGAAVITTLIEGSASVAVADVKMVLNPGEQAKSMESTLEKTHADLEAVTDWLQNDIIFNRKPLDSILLTVERIYNVRFTWQENGLKKIRFNGSVSRKKKLINILDYIRKTGPVDFIARDGKIMVIRKNKPGN